MRKRKEQKKEREDRFRKPFPGSARVRMVPALSAAARTWLAVHGDEWKYFGRKIGLEGLISSLLSAFLDMNEAARAKVLAHGIERAERYERDWNEEVARKVAAGELEVDENNNPIPKQPRARRRPPSAPVGLEDVGPDGPAVVLDDPDRADKPPRKRNGPKRRA